MIYYRFVNPDTSKGDITKNCGLDGTEIDSNFWELERNEIVKVEVDGEDLVITTYGGKEIRCDAFNGVERNMEFLFDAENGTLTIKSEGHEDRVITGFVTETMVNETINASMSEFRTEVNDELARAFAAQMEEVQRQLDEAKRQIEIALQNKHVYTDETLHGAGNIAIPLGIAHMHKTGLYRAIDSEATEIPPMEERERGVRYLLKDTFSAKGYMYNLDGVKRIAQMLEAAGSEWSVASGTDWDNMLNALEDEEEYRNHNCGRGSSSTWNGKVAGDKIKVIDDTLENWTGGLVNGFGAYPTGSVKKEETGPSFHAKRQVMGSNNLWSAYGIWWSMPLTEEAPEAFTKSINDDIDEVHKGMVFTEKINEYNFFPVRLVKHYNGNNFNEIEEILGQRTPCVLMPRIVEEGSDDFHYDVWTAINIAIIPTDEEVVEGETVTVAPEEGVYYYSFKPEYGVQDKEISAYYIYEVNNDKTLSSNKLNEREGVYVNISETEGEVVFALKILYKGQLLTTYSAVEAIPEEG